MTRILRSAEHVSKLQKLDENHNLRPIQRTLKGHSQSKKRDTLTLDLDKSNDNFSSVGETLVLNVPDPFENNESFKVEKLIILTLKNEIEVSPIPEILKKKKSTGPDALINKIMKCCLSIIEKGLTEIINTAIDELTFPSVLKIAKDKALNKNDKNNPETYRPITLLNVIGKVYEKSFLKSHVYFLHKSNLGFRGPIQELISDYLKAKWQFMNMNGVEIEKIIQ